MSQASEFKLYGAFGHYYDQHTPAHHYQHDHAFLIREIQKRNAKARILDIGCGSGVFIQKALAAGLDPVGLDPAPAMLELARQKVGPRRVRLQGMEALDDRDAFDAVTALSWSLNYARDVDQLQDILVRIKRALRPGGQLFVQVAHAAHAPSTQSDFFVDQEPGPGGPKDITFKYRFVAQGPQRLNAEYHFVCHSTGESFEELHELRVADAHLVAEMLRALDFQAVQLLEDFRGQAFHKTINPLLLASLADD